MIALPADWRIVHELDRVELVHAAGAGAAVIEYRERLRPLARVGELVRRYLAAHPELACTPPDVVEKVTTFEGEYGALASLVGRERAGERDRPVRVELGFVFGDDFYAQVAGTSRAPAHDEQVARVVRGLVVTDTHALGVRRRRFEYAPPRGWQAIVRGFVTDWFPQDYPRDTLHVTAYPANPVPHAAAQVLDLLLAPLRRAAKVERDHSRPLHVPSGLAGDAVELVVTTPRATLAKWAAALKDATYVYVLEATAREPRDVEAHRAELDALVASVSPLPQPHTGVPEHDYTAQAHWIE